MKTRPGTDRAKIRGTLILTDSALGGVATCKLSLKRVSTSVVSPADCP